MSKRSLFWGQASGKLGEAVYYRAGGEQRARTWISRIKNPKSVAQAANRISMLNLVSAFKSLKPIIREGFPLRPVKQSGFNAFVSANKNILASACSKEMLDNAICAPAGMYISKGDIPINTELVVRDHTDPFGASQQAKWGFVPTSLTLSNDKIPVETLPAGEIAVDTSGKVWAILHGSDNPMGLPGVFKVTVVLSTMDYFGTLSDGWQPSFITIEAKQNGTDSWVYTGNATNRTKVGMYLADATPSPEETPTTVKVESVFVGPIQSSKNLVDANICALIISYTNAGKIATTTSQIFAGDNNNDAFASFRPGGELYEWVLNEYTTSQESVLSTK